MNKRNLCLYFSIVFFISTAFFVSRAGNDFFSGKNLAKLCVATAYPNIEFSEINYEDTQSEVNIVDGNVEKEKKDSIETLKWEDDKNLNRKVKKGKPLVLIYHTHATESYLPSSEGNYHRVDEKNTVREVGNELEEILETRGINVIHDKTLHDNPSYNESYDRSFNTIKELLAKYPSVVYSIDLHRDAVPGTPQGTTIQVNGRKCSEFSYVLSTEVESYSRNRAFVDKLNSLGVKAYGNFKGLIRERPYTYNQEVGKCAILLEVGNNRNTIEESKACARIYGDILAKVIREEM